ncbi:MAG: type II secretion system F family protein [Pseudomonadota bacterium]
MALYSYISLDEEGKEHRGRLEADNIRHVADQLRQRAQYMVSAHEGGSASFAPDSPMGLVNAIWQKIAPGQYLSVRTTDLIFFFRQMNLMLGAGYTVVQSLEIAAKVIHRRRLANAVQRMADAIPSGITFAQAMATEKRIFPALMISLVESGEVSGQLDYVMQRIADNLQRRIDLRNQLVNAITYPAIVIIIAIAVIWFMMAKVIPKFAAFFAQRGKDLPEITQFLVSVSDVTVNEGPTIALVVGLITLFLFIAYTFERGKLVIDTTLLSVPVVGPTIKIYAASQIGSVFSTLLKSGFTAMEGMKVIATVMQNAYYRQAMLAAADEVLRGHSVANSFDRRHIPVLVQHMAAVGERSGELDTAMSEIGTFYQGQLDARVKTMVALTGPILTLVVGGVVGLVYIAMMIAVFRASTSF